MSGNACICCGRFRSHNLDPHRCVRCVNEQMVWEDARSWLPLARDRIEMLEAERDLFRGETVALAKDAMKLDAEVRALQVKIGDAIHHLEKARIWGGMGWRWNHLRKDLAERIHKLLTGEPGPGAGGEG